MQPLTAVPESPDLPSVAGRLAGRAVLVVGAGSSGPGWGNGKAAAVVYARAGAAVIVVDISLDAARDTVRCIHADRCEATALHADATDESSMASIVSQVHAMHGRLDVLHNNVGCAELIALHELPTTRWRELLE